jgi:hypothetical protein
MGLRKQDAGNVRVKTWRPRCQLRFAHPTDVAKIEQVGADQGAEAAASRMTNSPTKMKKNGGASGR